MVLKESFNTRLSFIHSVSINNYRFFICIVRVFPFSGVLYLNRNYFYILDIMKATLLSLMIVLSLHLFLKAQTSFPAQGNWYQKYHSIAWGHGGEIIWDITTFNSYAVAGDTVIGDSTFFRLQKNHALNYLVYEGGDKVYVGTDPDTLRLWFDYGLNPGDTFQFHAPSYSGWPYVLRLEVLSTDSVMVKGVVRKHIVFADIPGYGAGPEWIQGIGDINFGGLELDYSYVSWYANTMSLECFSQAGLNVYGVCTLGIDEITSSSMVSPNPSGGVFWLNAQDLVYPLHINAYNTGGMNVYSGEIRTRENPLLDLTALPSGVFLLKITDKQGKSKSQKILIQ
jgi:hypothetical protein